MRMGKRRGVFLFAVFLLSLQLACGKKGNPLPPIIRKPLPPSKLFVKEVGKEVFISFLLPPSYTDRASLEVKKVEVYREVLPLPSDNPAKRKAELSRHLKKFKGKRWRLLEGKELKKALLKRRVFLKDTIDLKKVGAVVYLYAVRVVDPKGNKSSFSRPVCLIPRLVAEPPADLSATVEESEIKLAFSPPKKNIDGSSPPLFLGFNIYRREEGGFLYISPRNSKPLAYLPKGWKVSGVIGLSRNEEAGRKILSFITAEGTKALITREIDLSSLKNALSGTISVSFSARVVGEEKVVGSFSFEASPKPKEPFKEERIEFSKDFSSFSFNCKLYKGLSRLMVNITPSRSPNGFRFEIADFKVSYLPEKGKEKLLLSDEIALPERVEFADRSFSFGKTYYYMVRSIYSLGGMIYESPDSEELKVVAKDTFPPPQPQGLTAITGDGTVHLSWQKVEAPDLMGYNLYRKRRGEKDFVKLNEKPILEPMFNDRKVLVGRVYIYFVKAVDRARNESKRSRAVMLTVR